VNFKAGDLVLLIPGPLDPGPRTTKGPGSGHVGTIVQPCACIEKTVGWPQPRWHVDFPNFRFPPMWCCAEVRLRKIDPPQAADADFDWRRVGETPVLEEST
jgi:hypothetical protein